MEYAARSSADPIDLGVLAIVFLAFAVLSFGTALSYDGVREVLVREQFTERERVLGPVTTERDNTTLLVSITHALRLLQTYGAVSSYIEAEVLDANREYLFSFGRELWSEAGYDEGRWAESDTHYEMNLTLPQAATYYLRFRTQADRDWLIEVSIAELRGSSIPHRILGLISLIIGIVLNELRNRTLRALLFRFASD